MDPTYSDADFSPRVDIRPFKVDDQDAAQAIINEGLADYFGQINPILNPDLEDITSTFDGRGHHFVVATLDERVIGTGGLLLESGNVGRIVRISVQRAWREKGIGKKIVHYLVRLAGERGLKLIWVETNLDWCAAIRLYKRCGFAEIYRDQECVHMALEVA